MTQQDAKFAGRLPELRRFHQTHLVMKPSNETIHQLKRDRIRSIRKGNGSFLHLSHRERWSQRATSIIPHIGLERSVQRRGCNAARVVRGGGGGNERYDFKHQILPQASAGERVNIPIVEASALLDQGFSQGRERRMLAVF